MNKNVSESEPSTSRKRPRDQESVELESENDVDNPKALSGEENYTFSDTLMALRMMHAQFPQIAKVSIQPFILRSQLYSSIKDRTQVDRELESFRRDKVLRIFKLNTGQDDHAIMFLDDYIKQIDYVTRRMEEKNKNDGTVFDWFKTHVIQLKLDTSISHQELCQLLSLGGTVEEEHISKLISAGLIFLCLYSNYGRAILFKIRQLIDPDMYWFSIPNIGSVLKGLSQGRKELLSILNRRKYKEMILASLEKKRLRLSPLDMRFHLRDLIGSGRLKTIQSPSGLIVRIAKD
ncbi:serine/threonine-protein kinase [Striga asiatica]|uniref:Serine/threonine-protein kinase n=1 Tax=Striga asiatica TaxID=4170 RepID=A0A5A7PA52_STRAF|nr:serine/threonine-protein kinase [Striga asiatica]